MIVVREARWAMLLVFSAAGCASDRSVSHVVATSPEFKSVREILRTNQEWERAVAGDNIEHTLSFWADDATIFLANDAPIHGKEAIEAFIRRVRSVPEFSMTWGVSTAGAYSKDFGYTIGAYSTRRANEHGEPVHERGHYYSIFEREDGAWRCQMQFRTSLPPSVRVSCPFHQDS